MMMMMMMMTMIGSAGSIFILYKTNTCMPSVYILYIITKINTVHKRISKCLVFFGCHAKVI